MMLCDLESLRKVWPTAVGPVSVKTRLAKIRDTEKLFVGIMVIQIFEMP